MRSQISAQLDRLITAILVLAVFLTPLLLTNLTTEFYETPKLAFLLIIICILLVLRSLSWVIQGKVLITRTPIDIPLLLFLGIMIISSLYAGNVAELRYIAFFGNFPRIHGSTISWVIYILFFFLATAHLRSKGQVKVIVYALLSSATVVAAITLLSFFGVYLPFKLTQFQNFTPAGTTFSAIAVMVLTLPILLTATLNKNDKYLPAIPAAILALLFLVTLGLVGDTFTLLTVVILALLIIIARSKEVKANFALFSLPLVIGGLVALMAYLPLGGVLHQKSANFPREVQLPFDVSWQVSGRAFTDNAFVGTGPSTYLFDFTYYKPVTYNNSKLWNVRFDTAFNEFFQVFATTGILGLLAFLFLAGVIVSIAWRGLGNREDSLAFSLSVSAIGVIILLALHPSTTVSVVASLVVLALLFTLHKNRAENVEELSIGIKASKLTDSNLVVGDALPVILLLPIVIVVLIALWNCSRMLIADYHHRVALDDAATRGIDTYNNLVISEQINPNVDLYHTDLAQTNFALANAIATSKGPSQASPSGSLTDQDKQNIQQLLSQSINEGKVAVALSPNSAQNWEILASIYRQISGVAQNALQFSLDAYGHAIQRDPFNPLLRLNVGGVYYSVKNYDLAIRFFTDAVNLKPDFANAWYNLAIAYKDKGDAQNALAAAQQIPSLVDSKSPDYQTATTLIQELQKQASSSAQPSPTTPPAAQQNGALQQDQQKILNLPKPSSIATPSAVKK